MKDKNTPNTIPLVLIRHAQSQWNKENRFTGWTDVPLTDAGVAEAKKAGDLLKSHGFEFDTAWTSVLQRARITMEILLGTNGQLHIPQYQDWRLNERHYGALQGKDKAEAMAIAGEAQVHRWRRGYQDRAEAVSQDDPSHPYNDPQYQGISKDLLPDGVESLADTRVRVVDCWQEKILPQIKQGQRLLISAHGNSLRALMMELEGMSVEEIEKFEIPTATPILYLFDKNGQPQGWHYLDKDAEQTRSA
ncbi:MAG: 2,3-bisphosphoglycerate-dependent phosphoglycerate mutase [Gammaproteobacteria bacterium]|nr:2,3-bisphosphoglycerate-dependent phosphoglycerate mutase [Gammaproteobacteria bacterium]